MRIKTSMKEFDFIGFNRRLQECNQKQNENFANTLENWAKQKMQEIEKRKVEALKNKLTERMEEIKCSKF